MLSVRLTLISLLVLPLASSLRAAPVVSAQIADFTVYDATPANEIDLTTKFSDPTLSANTVRLETVLGDIDVVLFDQKTPITVDNFLRYIDSGAFYPTDLVTGDPAPLFFHRSPDPDDFVIQSGGYAAAQDLLNPPAIFPTPVPQFDPIVNEARPDLHNVRGTISMAKLPNDPDSATSQWFINLIDNSGPPSNLDTTNGGYAVFGQVTTPSLAVIDTISDVPTYDATFLYGTAFMDLPLRNYSDSNDPKLENFINITSIIRPITFSATSSQTAVAGVSVISNDLFVQGFSPGTATITVTATDANGATASQSFAVTVQSTPVHAANISTRLQVGAGEDALIGGFIILGDAPKRVMIRAIGPSLEGVNGTL
ncbi:MAG: peptidylprolyl isomerase, partial [Chthoniobacterales bacterium]